MNRLCWPRVDDAGADREIDTSVHRPDARYDFRLTGPEALEHINSVEHRCIAIDVFAGNAGLGEALLQVFCMLPVDGKQDRRSVFAARLPGRHDVGDKDFGVAGERKIAFVVIAGDGSDL
jgi:hypothetical protein